MSIAHYLRALRLELLSMLGSRKSVGAVLATLVTYLVAKNTPQDSCHSFPDFGVQDVKR